MRAAATEAILLGASLAALLLAPAAMPANQVLGLRHWSRKLLPWLSYRSALARVLQKKRKTHRQQPHQVNKLHLVLLLMNKPLPFINKVSHQHKYLHNLNKWSSNK